MSCTSGDLLRQGGKTWGGQTDQNLSLGIISWSAIPHDQQCILFPTLISVDAAPSLLPPKEKLSCVSPVLHEDEEILLHDHQKGLRELPEATK